MGPFSFAYHVNQLFFLLLSFFILIFKTSTFEKCELSLWISLFFLFLFLCSNVLIIKLCIQKQWELPNLLSLLWIDAQQLMKEIVEKAIFLFLPREWKNIFCTLESDLRSRNELIFKKMPSRWVSVGRLPFGSSDKLGTFISFVRSLTCYVTHTPT